MFWPIREAGPDAFFKTLDLKKTQVQSLRTIHEETFAKQRPLLDKNRELHEGLNKELSKSDLDEQKIQLIIRQIQQEQSGLTAIHLNSTLEVRKSIGS